MGDYKCLCVVHRKATVVIYNYWCIKRSTAVMWLSQAREQIMFYTACKHSDFLFQITHVSKLVDCEM
jgi:hypothetical protein